MPSGPTLGGVSQVALVLEMAVALLAVPAGMWALGGRAQRRGLRLSVMAPFEEIYNQTVHTTTIEINIEAEAPAPAPGIRPRSAERFGRRAAECAVAVAADGVSARVADSNCSLGRSTR